MPRISINIPSDLMAKLDPIKDSINISQLCREALERHLSGSGRAAENNGVEMDVDELVTRLREEIVQEEGKFGRLGQGNAASWLATASYGEFQRVSEGRDISDMQKYKLPLAAFKTMKRDMKEADSTCEGAPAKEYKTAWLDFVRSVWTQVAPQLGQEDAQGAENNGNSSPDSVTEPAGRPGSGRVGRERVVAQLEQEDAQGPEHEREDGIPES